MVVATQLADSIAGDFGGIETLSISIPTAVDTESMTELSFLLVVICSALIGFMGGILIAEGQITYTTEPPKALAQQGLTTAFALEV